MKNPLSITFLLILRFHGKDTTEYRVLYDWDKVSAWLQRIREDPREEKKDLAAEKPEEVERIKGLIEIWHAVSTKNY